MILYNGSTGSLGAYFAGRLAARGEPGIALRSRLEARAALRDELTAIGERLGRAEPVTLVQLAANVSVPDCERAPDAAMKTNVDDTLATVEDFVAWAEANDFPPRVVYVSSGHVYAAQPHGVRMTEEHPVAPRSVYARSKLAAEQALAASAPVARHPLVIARVFGLIAPRQPAHYVLPGFLRRVLEGRLQAIPGLSYFRDYLDSRDVCDVLIQLAGASRVVNVCSGEPTRLGELVEAILRQCQPDDADHLLATLSEAPGRPDDIPWIVGDPTRLLSVIHEPARRIPLAQTVRDALAAQSG